MSGARSHKFQVAGHEGYITVGLYPDGQPGEIFLKMGQGRQHGLAVMDSLATMTSIGASSTACRCGRVHAAVRAGRVHRQPGDPDRQVHR